MLGVSYVGWTTIMALLEPHPALKAISPQASPADMWLGDDFHHNGAFRLSYGFEYAYEIESGKDLKHFGFDRYDTYEWYLALGPLSNVNARYFHGKIPTWNDFVAHPDYDAFWKRQAVIPYLRGVTVPTLNVAGWWDQEDFYGPLRIYEALERHDTERRNFLVVGPWNHGGWSKQTGDRLGTIPFDSSTSKHFREHVQAPWFAYFLKDKGNLDMPEALTFESGTNTWRRWQPGLPRRRPKLRRLYFGPEEALSFDRPTSAADNAFDAYRLRPGAPGAVPPPADPAHVLPGRIEDGRPGSSRISASSTTAPTS